MEQQPGRKLSRREQARLEDFQRLSGQMRQQGYRRVDLVVDVVQANVMAVVVMLPFLAAAAVLFFALNPVGEVYIPLSGMALWLLAFLVLVVLHEAIHGLTWGLMAPHGFKAIAFGVIWQMLTPYCTCNDGLKRWQYLLGGLMPTLILGFGLAGLATAQGSLWLFSLAEVMILGGGGDFLVVFKMLRHPQKEGAVYYDHPYECGLVVFEPENGDVPAA
ncbi:MAG: DUF3267 domain-containing protein [Fournierella sp.]|uniref:DUF3267 domain-containing protein n=1 Tax=Allofournierella sp. TaxID=1940256 RepID=UPI0025C52942|nr:DUF3267 domain-containing protein [Fournierella sp.]MDY4167361.1 DUF3267 domain-containing protein [Fournierella sp.]